METNSNKKQISYRLGVDLGTSSIGVAVYSLDEEGNIKNLEHIDSYIFGEPVDNSNGKLFTSNTSCRSARLIRRQVDHKAERLRKIGHIAEYLGVKREDLLVDKQDVIMLRALAVEQELTLPQLVKVFSHIVKNRGYKGTLKAADKNVGKKIQETLEKLENGNKTLGQLLYELKQNSNGKPLRKVEEGGTFIYRKEIEKEFERIIELQQKFHPELNKSYPVIGNSFPDYPGKKEISVKEAFHSAIFYQRPIKWELETVGNCEIYPTEKRASCAQPAYQHYRMAKDISDLRWYDKNISFESFPLFAKDSDKPVYSEKNPLEPQPLTLAQQVQLLNHIEISSKEYEKENGVFPFKKIYEFLDFPEGRKFTIDRKHSAKGGIKGNTTLWAFEKANCLNDWENLTDIVQELVIEFFANITTFSDIKDNTDEYIKKEVIKLTENIKVSDSYKIAAADFILLLRERKIFEDFSLESGRASYSVKGLKYLTERIQSGENIGDILYQISQERQQTTGKLRTVHAIKQQEAITDPVISKALREFHRVMTYITHKYGNPSEMVIELSRDIKNSLRRRQYLEGQSKVQAEERKKALNELEKHGVLKTPRNIEKYLLWEEQNHLCPYSGDNISFAQAFDEKSTQVDHIIPQAKGGPNVFENKVLAFTQENKDKSNRLPYEWKFQKDIDDYKAFYSDKKAKKKTEKKPGEAELSFGNHSSLLNFVQHLRGLYNKEKKGYLSQRERKWKPSQKGMRILRKINNLLMTSAELKEDFSARQNQETAWIGKIVMGWCKDICPKVTPSYGSLTAYIRKELDFGLILPQIRIEEGKDLFDENNSKLDIKKWEELFTKKYKHLGFNETDSLKEDFAKYVEGLPEKPNTDSDMQKAFLAFCAEQRGSFKFNKRCDHRHHAVDAAVIGLCDFSLVQKASIHNRKYGTLDRIKYFDENRTHIKEKDTVGFDLSPIFHIAKAMRELLQNRLTNYVVYHKPDHFPSGAFFDETAYNIAEKEGAERFIKRAALSTFIKKTPKDTINNLEKLLFADTIKNVILEQFKERLAKGLTQEEALCGKKEDLSDGIYYRGNKIKQVKYMYLVGTGLREFNPDADIKIKHTDKGGKEHIKGYQNAGYACMDFDTKTGKRINLIPLWKYQQNKQVPEGVARVFKNDILFDKKDRNFYLVKQLKADKGMGLINVTEVNSALTFTSNLKNHCLVNSRQDIAKLKDEYSTSN